MYYVTGADGQEYGPVGLDILQKWISGGRVNAQSLVRVEGSVEWKPAAEWPEINHLLERKGIAAPLQAAGPPPIPGAAAPEPNTSLAMSSLVLGILAMVCLGPLMGIPAIICGHMARARIRRAPKVYAGAGMAVAGLIMGYLSVILVLVVVAMVLPRLNQFASKDPKQATACRNNMKMIGLSFKVWALDNNDRFPFNVSTNQGGTMEFASQGADGEDPKAYLHLMVMSNELATTKILVCPADKRTPAHSFSTLKPENVSYQIMSGVNVTEENPLAVLAVCPLHGNVLTADGAVQTFENPKGPKKRK